MPSTPPLFDANGTFGKPATGSPDFPTIRSVLDHMDRLGIGRSVVWNVEARQHHAPSANRRLLDEIGRTPGAAGRIVPAMVVTPLVQYEAGALADLKQDLIDHDIRALRFTRGLVSLTLDQLAPVIEAVRFRRPVLFLRHDETDTRDILDFAARFPDIPLVLGEVMWGPLTKVLDLMRQRPNIHVELSWMHTWGNIALAARHFGADRVLFGTGYRSHNGAAIAALMRDNLTAADRARIAHGNLDRLLGLPPTPAADAPRSHARRSALWRTFLSGRPLRADVVDAHIHIGPSAGYVLEVQEDEPQAQLAVDTLRRTGIRTLVASGLPALLGAAVEGNDLLERVLAPHAGQLLGYVGFNPFYGDDLVRRFDRYFRGGVFVGFKLLCDYWHVPVTDPRFKPMWDYANRRRLPILIHTWGGSTCDAPRLLRDIVKPYPDAAFLLGHSGGSDDGRREAEELAVANPNVYLETCGSFCSTIRWEDTLKTVSPRQIVYGSDAMAHDIHWELGRILSLDVDDRALRPILGGNMRRILSQRV